MINLAGEWCNAPFDVSLWFVCATMIKGPYYFQGILKRPPICYLLWSDEVQEKCIISEWCSTKVKGVENRLNSYQGLQQDNVEGDGYFFLGEIILSFIMVLWLGY